MISGVKSLTRKHFTDNFNTYFFLLLAFIVGISAGAFTVNGLSTIQKDELSNYFQGFLQLFDNQKVDSSELLKISVIENMKIIIVIWILGVSIIGIPFIYLVVGIRGFITGFSSGFIIETLGFKGIIFTMISFVPKEVIIIPCVIALGVRGVNFSFNIIKNKSRQRFSKESLKSSFIAYCGITLFYTMIIFSGILVEAYITPVLVKMIAPLITI